MTIREIAKEANVSVATVSRTINNQPGVGSVVRKRVQDIIDSCNAETESKSQNLHLKKMRAVGVLVPNLTDNHMAVTANVIQTELLRNDLCMILGTSGADDVLTERYILDFLDHEVVGIIFVGSIFNDLKLQSFLLSVASKTPIIMTNCLFNKKNIQSVRVEVSSGAIACCQHLLDLGHTHIGFIHDKTSKVSAKYKLDGFKQCLEANGLAFEETAVYSCNMSVGDAYAFTLDNIETLKQYTAIMCTTDNIALGVTKAILESGLRIPQDMAITGYNNSSFSKYVSPSLTTVDNQHDVVGTMAVNLLINALHKSNFVADLSVKPTLIIRESTVKGVKKL
jgi:LacI family transcriptional regulator